MLQTLEAVLQPDGSLQFLEPPPVPANSPRHVLVTFTEPVEDALCGAALSETALATDWLRDEENAAWAHLQFAK